MPIYTLARLLSSSELKFTRSKNLTAIFQQNEALKTINGSLPSPIKKTDTNSLELPKVLGIVFKHLILYKKGKFIIY